MIVVVCVEENQQSFTEFFKVLKNLSLILWQYLWDALNSNEISSLAKEKVVMNLFDLAWAS